MGYQKLILYIFLTIAGVWTGYSFVRNPAMSPRPLLGGQKAHADLSLLAWADRIMTVNATRYLLSDSPKISPIFSTRHEQLVTVIKQQSEHAITLQSIRDIVTEYTQTDDVWQAAFLHGVIFLVNDPENVTIDLEAQKYLKSVGNSWIDILSPDTAAADVHSGPHVILEGKLHEVFKLVDDMHGTFMTAVKPLTSDTYEALQLKSSIDDFSAVALPTRIKSHSCSGRPFCGNRIAIKDNLYLKGIKASLQCRAYYNMYDPNIETAQCIRKLTDGGAHILGTLKMNPFGHWVEPIEYVDYQAPWNPRADGYQSAGGSSTGPASALAAYDWLDLTIGTDTWGSIMRPALWCGLFGLRPTTGTVSRQGLKRGITFMDTPAVLVRDLVRLKPFVDSWLDHDHLQTSPKAFTSIIWATDMWETVDQNQRDLAEGFYKLLGTALGLNSSRVSFAQRWAEDSPKEALGQSLDEYMVKAIGNLAYQPAQSLYQFGQDHYRRFGTKPYFSPPVQRNLDNLRKVTDSDFEEALEHMKVYQNWFHTKIWQSDTSHPLVMLPIENMTPRYRDETPDFRRPPPGVNSIFLAPVLGAPELLVPIDEIPYQSRVTGRQENLPFVIGLMSLPGTELMLVEETYRILAKSAKYHTKVYTGRNMFSESDTP